MSIHTSLAAAIASVLITTSAAHAAPRLDTSKVIKRNVAAATSTAQPSVGQRFIVKTTGTTTQSRSLLTQSLASSAQRSGITTAAAATARAAARPAARASVLRNMAVPGWYVVQT